MHKFYIVIKERPATNRDYSQSTRHDTYTEALEKATWATRRTGETYIILEAIEAVKTAEAPVEVLPLHQKESGNEWQQKS